MTLLNVIIKSVLKLGDLEQVTKSLKDRVRFCTGKEIKGKW